jgi:hypothetical protein
VPSSGDEENDAAGGRETAGTENAVIEFAQTVEAESARRCSNTSDNTISSSDSSLILIDSSEPGPSNATYDRELDEELSPNMTSCIDISSASSAGTTVQWTRENHYSSNPELATDTPNINVEENAPTEGETLCSRNSSCDSVDSAAETDDELLMDALGSSGDVTEPDGGRARTESGNSELAESATCLPTSPQPDLVHIDINIRPNSNKACITDISEPDDIENLPNV